MSLAKQVSGKTSFSFFYSSIAETVTSDVLAAWLGSKKAVLLIDCRSFGISDKKKLKGALLMRCSSIKIRRCKGAEK